MSGAALKDALRSYVALSLSRAEDYRAGQLAVLCAEPRREALALAQRVQQQEALRERKEQEIWGAVDGVLLAAAATGEAQWAAACAACDAAVVGRVRAILEGCGGGGRGGGGSGGGASAPPAWRRDKKALRQLALLYRFMPNLALADPRALGHRAVPALQGHSAGLRQRLAAVVQDACSESPLDADALQALRQDLAADEECAGKLMDYSAALSSRLGREAQAASLAAQPLPPPLPLPRSSAQPRIRSGSSGVRQRQQHQHQHQQHQHQHQHQQRPVLPQLHIEAEHPAFSSSPIPEELAFAAPQHLQPKSLQQHASPSLRQLPSSGGGRLALIGSAQRTLLAPLSAGAAAAAPAPQSTATHLEHLARRYSPRTPRELRRVEVSGASRASGADSSGIYSATSPSLKAGGLGAHLRYPSPALQGRVAPDPHPNMPLVFRSQHGPSPTGSGGAGGSRSSVLPAYASTFDFSTAGAPTPTAAPGERDWGWSSGSSSSAALFSSGSSSSSSAAGGSGGNSNAVDSGGGRELFYSGLSDMIALALAPSTPAPAHLAHGPSSSSADSLLQSPSFSSPAAASATSATSVSPASSYKAAAGSWLQAKGITLPSLHKGLQAPTHSSSFPHVPWQRSPLPPQGASSSSSSSSSGSSSSSDNLAGRVSSAIALARSALAQMSTRASSPRALDAAAAAAAQPQQPPSPTYFPKGASSSPASTERLRHMSSLAASAVADLALGKSMGETNVGVFGVSEDGQNRSGGRSPLQAILADPARLR